MVGDYDEATNTYGKYFEGGCVPKPPPVTVLAVEEKLHEHLDSQGLGMYAFMYMNIYVCLYVFMYLC